MKPVVLYHTINRGNNRQEFFHKPEDYQAFLRTLREGLGKYSVDLFSFCLRMTQISWRCVAMSNATRCRQRWSSERKTGPSGHCIDGIINLIAIQLYCPPGQFAALLAGQTRSIKRWQNLNVTRFTPALNEGVPMAQKSGSKKRASELVRGHRCDRGEGQERSRKPQSCNHHRNSRV